MSRPILPILASYLTGLIAGYYFSIPSNILIALIFISLSLTASSILIKNAPAMFFTFSMLALSILGVARMNNLLNPFLPETHIANQISDEPVSLEGRICEPPERLLDKTRLYIDLSALYVGAEPHPMTGKLLLTIGSKYDSGEARPPLFKYGDTIRFLAKPRKPRNFHNPGGFDYERSLALKGIFASAYLKDGYGIIKTAEGISSVNRWIEGIRDSIREHVFKSAGTTAPVLLALITGEQGEIQRGIREDFSRAGTAHILAISGEHIGIIALASFALFLWLLKRSELIMLHTNIYKGAAVLTIPAVILYTLIAGSGFSIVRAGIMGGTLLVAVLVNRRRDIPSLIASAAFLILVFEPQALFDISFQLSFASVISLAMAAPYLKMVYSRNAENNLETGTSSVKRRIISWLAIPAAVSLAATIWTAPLVAYYFNRFSIISPLSNLITVPLVGLIVVPLGLISSIFIPISQTVSGLLIKTDSQLLSLIIWLTSRIAAIPMSSIRVVTPNIFEISLFYIAVVLFIYRGRIIGWKRFFYTVSAILIILESFYFFKPFFQKELRVTFLDVGQGESALVEFPGGQRMLIDGGGLPMSDFEIGERVLAPFLWHKKIGRIDYVVLSHPNSDHYGGLPFILRNFNVGEIWESGVEEKSEGYLEFKKAVRESGGIHKKVGDGDRLSINSVSIDVMNPPKDYKTNSDRDANNGSVVLKLAYGKTSFLFTGDIEKEAEYLLLSKGNELKCTVLKVPHHGSLTSSSIAFLDKARPDKAVFSVGYSNQFGFPKESITKRYKDVGTSAYRTDRDGAIIASTDGVKSRFIKTLNHALSR
ncbi:MAG: metallo-beta-lactamase superfamily [Deltaproteobacteria bacterium]|nr:metallo-beta-lactamase superfamily [Deltaproteobacteria bacterium]